MWTKDRLYTYIDSEDNIVLDVDMSDSDFFTKGGWANQENPWKFEEDMNAPFNREFYLIFNVAVGGTNGYFPSTCAGKPYDDTDPHAPNTFFDNLNDWYPSWNYPASHDAAMKIDSVRVWSLDGEEQVIQ